jgi:hypothetical protein
MNPKSICITEPHRLQAAVLVWLVLPACLLLALRAAAQEPPEVRAVELSPGPQLFLDGDLIAACENVHRRIETPRKHPQNPLIVRDHPWEKRFIELYGTVLFDPDLQKFRCWYLANEHRDGVPDVPEEPRTVEYYMCYAESSDGIAWTKPLVGKEKFGSHRRHNVVIPGGHGFCVLQTPDDPDPSRRFKGAGGGVFGFSPDGIRWSTRDWRLAVGKNDTNSSVVRWHGEYLAFVRYQVADPQWPAVMRGVGLSTSDDFEHWTHKQLVFTTDGQDGYPWTQPYSLAVTPYGGQLIGIVTMLGLDRIEGNNMLGDQTTQLLVSRDGRRWRRVADRQEFLAPTRGSWDAARVFPGTSMIVKDDQVLIYYTGIDTRHGDGQWGNPAIGLATLPADRFVAVEKCEGTDEGIVQTSPLRFRGDTLLVNADVQNGDLEVELLDRQGNVLADFARDRCHLTVHDALRYRVTWQNGGQEKGPVDVAALPAVALRFIIRGGKLYAFEVRE